MRASVDANCVRQVQSRAPGTMEGSATVVRQGSFPAPLVSVILATYNAAGNLQRSIDSVLSQSYRNIELIAVDGGSTDGTVSIIERNAPYLAAWVSEADEGIYHAWNKALDRARGDWIYFLGADDYLLDSTVIDRLAVHLRRALPRFKIVYGRVAVLNEQNQVVEFAGIPWDRARRRFFTEMNIPHQGIFHHRSLFEMHGYFDQSLKRAADYEMLLRELKTGEPLFAEDVLVAAWTLGGTTGSPEHSFAVLQELREAQRRHGVGGIGIYWLLAKAWLKRWLVRNLGQPLSGRLIDLYRRVSGRNPRSLPLSGE